MVVDIFVVIVVVVVVVVVVVSNWLLFWRELNWMVCSGH